MWVLAASKRKHGAQVTKQQLFLFILADHIQNLFINSHLVFFPFITDSVHLLRIKNRNRTLYLYDNFQFPYIHLQLFTFLSYRHKMGTGNMKLFHILKMQTYFFTYFFYWNKISLICWEKKECIFNNIHVLFCTKSKRLSAIIMNCALSKIHAGLMMSFNIISPPHLINCIHIKWDTLHF